MEYTHFVSVAGLVCKGDEILLVKSPRRGWEYPGGMVEPGESLEAALHREILEESGVTVSIRSLAGICKNVQKDVVNVDFICDYLDGELQTSSESTEVRWVHRDEAMALATFPLTRKRLGNMLQNAGQMYCFGFTREPFDVVEDHWYDG